MSFRCYAIPQLTSAERGRARTQPKKRSSSHGLGGGSQGFPGDPAGHEREEDLEQPCGVPALRHHWRGHCGLRLLLVQVLRQEQRRRLVQVHPHEPRRRSQREARRSPQQTLRLPPAEQGRRQHLPVQLHPDEQDRRQSPLRQGHLNRVYGARQHLRGSLWCELLWIHCCDSRALCPSATCLRHAAS